MGDVFVKFRHFSVRILHSLFLSRLVGFKIHSPDSVAGFQGVVAIHNQASSNALILPVFRRGKKSWLNFLFQLPTSVPCPHSSSQGPITAGDLAPGFC